MFKHESAPNCNFRDKCSSTEISPALGTALLFISNIWKLKNNWKCPPHWSGKENLKQKLHISHLPHTII